MEKNKKLIFHPQTNVEDVMDMVQNPDLNQFPALCVAVKVK